MIASGHTSREIAIAIGRSLKTIETHRDNIRRKTGTHSTVGMIAWALRHKLVELP